MAKVAPLQQRKADHIQINLEKDVRSALTSGLDRFRFIHEALPELNLEDVDTRVTIFGKALSAPILISSDRKRVPVRFIVSTVCARSVTCNAT